MGIVRGGRSPKTREIRAPSQNSNHHLAATIDRPLVFGGIQLRPSVASLVARYSAILRYYSCYTPYSAIPSEGSLTCDTPPLILLCMQANVNAIGVCTGGIARWGAIAGKQRVIGYSYTLSRDMGGGYSACAVKVASLFLSFSSARQGPLGGGVGRVQMEPLVLFVFFPLFSSKFWPNLRPIPVARPVVVLCPFQAPKTLRFKAYMANF